MTKKDLLDLAKCFFSELEKCKSVEVISIRLGKKDITKVIQNDKKTNC